MTRIGFCTLRGTPAIREGKVTKPSREYPIKFEFLERWQQSTIYISRKLTSSCHSDATIWGQSYLLKKIKFYKEANSPMPNGGYAGVHHSKHTKRRHENVTPGLSFIHFLSRLSCSASRGDDTYSRKEDYASTDHHSQNTVCTFTSLPSGSWTSPACSHIREEHSPSRCSPSHYCEKFKCSSKVCVPWSTMWSKRDDIWAM